MKAKVWFSVTVLCGLLLALAAASGTSTAGEAAPGNDGGLFVVEDAVAQFDALKHHPEALAWRNPEDLGAPDPSIYDHYQGLARNPGPGVPVFYVSHLDDDDGGTAGGYLHVVRFASRTTTGERLRSNLRQVGNDTEEAYPPVVDTWKRSIRFDGTPVFDGVVLPTYKHPGSMALVDDVLFVPVDQPTSASSPTGQLLLFDVSADPTDPVPLQALTLSHSIDNVAVTRLSNDVYRIWTNGDGGNDINIYDTTHTDLRDNNLALTLVQTWDPSTGLVGASWPTGTGAHQSSTFLRENDDTLYLIGMRHPGGSPFSGSDYADLYRVTEPQKGKLVLTHKRTRHLYCVYDGGGGPVDMRVCNMAASNNAYVSPTGELILYSIPHDDEDGFDPDIVRMGEFRHRDVVRPGSPLLQPVADLGGPYEVDEGSTVLMDASGSSPPLVKGWAELYDDKDFTDRSVVLDWDDRDKDNFENFEKLDNFGDKASSVRWMTPVGSRIVLYKNHDYEDRYYVLQGTGQVRSISDLEKVNLRNTDGTESSENVGDEISSMRFEGAAAYEQLAGYDYSVVPDPAWGAGETYSVSPQGGSQAVFSAEYGDGPREVWVNLTVTTTSGRTDTDQAVVSVLNVPPTIDDYALSQVEIAENGLVVLKVWYSDPGVLDTHTMEVDWGDGTIQQYDPLVPGTFIEIHRYLDDDPTVTSWDTYTVRITVRDDDGGEDTVHDHVMVKNVAPVITATGDTINENGVATVSGTINDPGTQDTFAIEIDWGEGAPETFHYPAGATDYSEMHQYLDDNPTGTMSDVYPISVSIEDDDGGSGDAGTSVTVIDVAPIITATGDTIDEDGVATVSGMIIDPGTEDTFEVEIDWGEGAWETFYYPAGATAYSEQHQYLDDNPGGTMSDDYNVKVFVADDDMPAPMLARADVTVNNVPPVASIDSMTDETGAQISVDVPVALMGLEVDLAGSFTDVGTLDTHTATINWGDGGEDDLGAVPGPITAAHVFADAGMYTMTLTVTDDDTGVGTATAQIEVVDAAGAIARVVERLTPLAADPKIAAALDKLNGRKGGRGGNGALDALAKGNLSTALGKISEALEKLEAAEAAAPGLDLTHDKGLLALAAKSVAVNDLARAEGVAFKAKDLQKIQEARDLVAQGDGRLALLGYIGAVENYELAVRAVQRIR